VHPPAARFYSHATCSAYSLDPDSVADALTAQAMQTVDFPRLVTRAASDGVRVFIEHGQHAMAAQWIDKILADTPHLAVALTPTAARRSPGRRQCGPTRVAGVPVDVGALQRALARHAGARERGSAVGSVPAHWPPVRTAGGDRYRRALRRRPVGSVARTR
jgi:acyl transferase domain-containing protein